MEKSKYQKVFKLTKQLLIPFILVGILIGVIFSYTNVITDEDTKRYENNLLENYVAHFEVINMTDNTTMDDVLDSINEILEFWNNGSSEIYQTSDNTLSIYFGITSGDEGVIIPDNKLESYWNILLIVNKPELSFYDLSGSEIITLDNSIIKQNSAKATFVGGEPVITIEFKSDSSKLTYQQIMNEYYYSATQPPDEGAPAPTEVSYNIWLDYEYYENLVIQLTNNEDYLKLINEPFYPGDNLYSYSFYKDLNGTQTSLKKDISKPFLIGSSAMNSPIDPYSDEIVIKSNFSSKESKYYANRINYGSQNYEINYIGGYYEEEELSIETFNWLIIMMGILILITFVYLITKFGALGLFSSLGILLTLTLTLLISSLALIPISTMFVVSIFVTFIISLGLWINLLNNYKEKINSNIKTKKINSIGSSYKDVLTESNNSILYILIISIVFVLFGFNSIQSIALVFIIWTIIHYFLYNVIFKYILFEIIKIDFIDSRKDNKGWNWTNGFVNNESKFGSKIGEKFSDNFGKINKTVIISFSILLVLGSIVMLSLSLTLGKSFNYTSTNVNSYQYEIAMINDNSLYGDRIYEPDSEWGSEAEVEIENYYLDVVDIVNKYDSNAEIEIYINEIFTIEEDINANDYKIVSIEYEVIRINTVNEIDNYEQFSDEIENIVIVDEEIDSLGLIYNSEKNNYAAESVNMKTIGFIALAMAVIAMISLVKDRWSGSLAMTSATLFEVSLISIIIGALFIPISLSIWIIIFLATIYSISTKSKINSTFLRKMKIDKDKFTKDETLNNIKSDIVKSESKSLFKSNLVLFILGIVLAIFSAFGSIELLGIGLSLIIISLINYFVTLFVFVKFRKDFELFRQLRREKKWNEDVQLAHEHKSEELIEGVNS